MTNVTKRIATTAVALSLGLALGACAGSGGVDSNSTLYSMNQPVVARHNYTLDLAANSAGLTAQEKHRLAGWFDAMEVGYGDRIAIQDPTNNPAVRADVAEVAGQYGLLLAKTAPVTVGFVDAGNIRVVLSRSTAQVPGCPNWSHSYASHLGNDTSPNFGCATNANLAAMVADPEQLLHGAKGTGDTVIMTSDKAIETYRKATPTGASGLPVVSTKNGN